MADVNIRVRQTVEGSNSVVNFGQKLTNVLQGVQVAAAAATAAGLTFKKAFDIGREGAALKQIDDSFNRLNETVFKTPQLLDDMRNAARGTVRDVDLMAATLTITAGTTGEMSKALARATPEIVAMAKAANAINPAFGSTTFLIESLSVAAKRQSRLLADNAGIIVKMESAIKKVHPALKDLAGTYEELPDELRFLNEMLHQGENLLLQAGGAADSATDAYDRLTVKVQEYIDRQKEALGLGLLPWVEAAAGDNSAVIDNIVENNLAGIESMEDFEREFQRYNKTLSNWMAIGAALTGSEKALEEGLKSTATAAALTAESYEEYAEIIGTLEGRAESVAHRHGLLSEAFYHVARGAEAANMEIERFLALVEGANVPDEEIEEYGRALLEGADADRKFTGELNKGTDALGDNEDALDGVNAAMLTYEMRREGIFDTDAFLKGLERERQGLSELEYKLKQTQDAMMELAASEREMSYTTMANVIRGREGAAEWAEIFEEQAEAAEEMAQAQERAAAEAQQAIERYWSSIESITSSALGAQFDLINDIADTRAEIERLRDAVEANPGDMGLVRELESALERFDDLTGQAAASWEEMVLDIIMETGGFDRVAADFAVAAGIMTQAQADAQLGAVQMAEALQNIGLAIDQGAISPEQGAELFNTLLGGMDDTGTAIAEAQAMLDAFTGGGINLGAATDGGIPPQLQGVLDGFDALPDSVQIDFSQVDAAITETGTLSESLLAIQDVEWVITVDDTQVTTALEHVAMLQEALVSVGGTTTTITVPPLVGGGIGHAHGTGGWRQVPPGFPNDTYPAFLSSGEVYNVMTPGQATSASDGGGQHVDARTYIVATGRESMALALASAGQKRRSDRNRYMGGG